MLKEILVKMRKDARIIFNKGVENCKPEQAIKNTIKLQDNRLVINKDNIIDLNLIKNIYVVGAGKAASSMAATMEKILGFKISKGIVNTKYGYIDKTSKNIIKVNECDHPIPDENGINGTKEIIELLNKTTEHDLVIALLSGGGSALFVCPPDNISLEEVKKTTDLFLKCGATIDEINTVRKHLSKVKGGQLLKYAYPSKVFTFILSDVIGDPLDIIASGPTSPDPSSFRDALNIIEKYNLKNQIPENVFQYLLRGVDNKDMETPDKESEIFKNNKNMIIGSNILALEKAESTAKELGYHPIILSSYISCESKLAAGFHIDIAKEILATGNPVSIPACIISGGETTVKVKGKGSGGSNQEFVLACVPLISKIDNIVVAAGDTDGTDGFTDVSGAIVDSTTYQRANELSMKAEDYLETNDSYHYFEKLGDHIITGPTNTNVNDLRIILIRKST